MFLFCMFFVTFVPFLAGEGSYITIRIDTTDFTKWQENLPDNLLSATDWLHITSGVSGGREGESEGSTCCVFAFCLVDAL